MVENKVPKAKMSGSKTSSVKQSKKQNSKAFGQQKRHRRQLLAFLRMLRYGVNNFSRNAWLTIAATAVMTITLLIIFLTVAAQNVLVASIDEISQKVDMSIYLKTDTTSRQASPVMDDLMQLSNVRDVKFVSSDEARAENAEKYKGNRDMINAITQATNKLPATIRVSLKNINDTSELDHFVKDNDKLSEIINPDLDPSFAGSRRAAIQNLGKWTDFAQRAGLIASVVFVAISSLIVFNTIRMAIFNRRDEIEMMKLIGADKSFIRGPFIVEATVYGVIAALVATGLGIAAMALSADKLHDYGVAVQGTFDYVVAYLPLVLLAMVVLGALVGIISSLLATRRYLKI